MTVSEIATLLTALVGMATGIYSIWSGRQKQSSVNSVTASQIEAGLREALFSDFQRQREENKWLKKRVRVLEQHVRELESRLAELGVA